MAVSEMGASLKYKFQVKLAQILNTLCSITKTKVEPIGKLLEENLCNIQCKKSLIAISRYNTKCHNFN